MAITLPAQAQLDQFDGGSTGLETSGDSLLKLIQKIIEAFLGLVAVIAVIVIIYAGVKYILSMGEEDQAEDAKRMILYALIGLVVVGLSAVIVNFTLGAISGQSGGGGGQGNQPGGQGKPPALPGDGSKPKGFGPGDV